MYPSYLKAAIKFVHFKNLRIPLTFFVCLHSIVRGQKFVGKHEEFRDENLLKRKLTKDGIIPELLGNPPQHAPEFVFASGAMADFGNRIRSEDVYEPPRVVRLDCEPDDMFTILLTDYDASERISPRKREWLHWAVGNCKGNNLLDGDTLAPFLPLNPEKSTDAGRKHFSTRNFAEKYDFGNVYGLNYFISEWVADEDKDPWDS